MQFSILVSANNSALVNAMLNIADDNGYNVTASKTRKYILIDTTAKTVVDAAYKGSSTLYSLGSQMGEVTALLEARTTTRRSAAVAAPRVTIPSSVMGSNGLIRVGDKVVRVKQAKKSRFNTGTTGVVLTVTGFTATGKLILQGLSVDQYSAKKFAKVTLSTRKPKSGDKLVVVKESTDRKFMLGLNKIYTFRGLTVEKGNYILDGQNVHQYAPSRFAVVLGL